MNKEIKAHAAFVRTSLETVSQSEAKELLAYHQSRVQDFQHERFVHLIVTLFFGALLVGSVVAVAVIGSQSLVGLESYLLSAVTILLLATELCYIWYYYLLENGVQKLYLLTTAIRQKALGISE